MKTLKLLAGILSLVVLLTLSCTTNQQKIGYNTLYSVERSTVAAYDGYISLVAQGKVPTNDVPKIAKAFNLFQSASLVALDGVQFNTNAIAPTALLQESEDLIALINSITGKH